MKNIKPKNSSLIMAIAIISITTYQSTHCLNTRVSAFPQTKTLRDKTAKKYTSQVTTEEEKLENLKNNPKATEEQISKQEEKVETVRKHAINWINKTYQTINEMSTPAKLLFATLTITGTDYPLETDYTSLPLSKIDEWVNLGTNKAQKYLTPWPTKGTPEYNALLNEEDKKAEADIYAELDRLKAAGLMNSAKDAEKLDEKILNNYPFLKNHIEMIKEKYKHYENN